MRYQAFAFVVIALCATFAHAADPLDYTSFQGEKLKLHAWKGTRVMILTASADRDPKVMAKLTAGLDKVYDFYKNATGREPHKRSSQFIDGLTTVAEVNKTCGAGCGFLGATGIELTGDTFETLYRGIKERDEWDQVICYEFGRNFWFYGEQIEYRDKGDTQRSVTTGYAVFMRFMAMEAAGLKGGPFRDRSFEKFKTEVEGLADLVEKDPAMNWGNTLRLDQAPQNPMGLNGTDLFAGMLFRLRRENGGDEFINKIWKEVAKRPRAKTTQDALDNLAVAASIAAGKDLTPAFTQRWRWTISDAAKAEAAKITAK